MSVLQNNQESHVNQRGAGKGEGGGGLQEGGGSGHRSQRFKTQNHKSQSFQMMISQITDNELS